MVGVNKRPADGVLGSMRGLPEPPAVAHRCQPWYPTPFMASRQAASRPEETTCVTRSGIKGVLNNVGDVPSVYFRETAIAR